MSKKISCVLYVTVFIQICVFLQLDLIVFDVAFCFNCTYIIRLLTLVILVFWVAVQMFIKNKWTITWNVHFLIRFHYRILNELFIIFDWFVCFAVGCLGVLLLLWFSSLFIHYFFLKYMITSFFVLLFYFIF